MFDFVFHDSDVTGSALINTASARGFSKACLVCHGFENLDFTPVAESTARVKAFGASDPRRALRWPRVWEGSSPPPPSAALPPPFMDMDGKTYRGCIGDKGQTLH